LGDLFLQDLAHPWRLGDEGFVKRRPASGDQPGLVMQGHLPAQIAFGFEDLLIERIFAGAGFAAQPDEPHL
jgi:hypothetical protein